MVPIGFVWAYFRAEKRGQGSFLFDGKPYSMSYGKALVDSLEKIKVGKYTTGVGYNKPIWSSDEA